MSPAAPVGCSRRDHHEARQVRHEVEHRRRPRGSGRRRRRSARRRARTPRRRRAGRPRAHERGLHEGGDLGIPGEQQSDDSGQCADHDARRHAEPHAPRERAAEHARTRGRSSAPSPLPMRACAAIASASSAKAAVEKIVNATCHPASSAVPSPGRHHDGREQRHPQRHRAQEQPPARACRAVHAFAMGTDGCRVPPCEPAHDDRVRGHHAPLGDDRAGGGPRDAPARGRR